jgi:hypothetical protein
MAITPAWVRLRDTGRDEPQSVLHCKFLQYTTVPRYRIFFFGVWGISVFAIWISPPGDPHRIRAVGRAARTRARAAGPRRAQVAAGGRAAGRRASPHGRMRIGLRAAGTHASCMDKAQGQAPFPLLPRWERD